MLKILIYASEIHLRRRLLDAISSLIDRCSIETYAELPGLTHRLKSPGSFAIWLVLVTVSHRELSLFAAMGELIHNTRSILVLPDQQRDTLAAGHTLYPRFISYLDSDFSDICTVLATVIRNSETHHSHSFFS